MKPKTYEVLEMAVEAGCNTGVRRYYKYRDSCPGETELGEMAEVVRDAVMSLLLDWFDLEDKDAAN